MRYPVPSGEDDAPDEETPRKETKSGGSHDGFTWDLDAEGQVTAHM